MRDPFRDASRRFDAPDIHAVGQRTLHEVDEGLIHRPEKKMTVKARGRRKNLPALRRLTWISDEHRIARPGRVVNEPGRVARPVEFGHALEIGARLSSQNWNGPDADVSSVRAVGLARPEGDERTVGRESQCAHRWID